MRASNIPEQEEKFKTALTNTSRVKYTLENVTKLDKCEIHHIRPKFDSYYYPVEIPKKKIVLHYTVGTIRGDMASLTKKGEHMSVAYVIARNGIIYELFSPKYWSYHLGRGSVGGNGVNSKDSIGIELSNYGPLKLVGDNLETMYSHVKYTNSKGKEVTSKKDIYCSTTEIDYYDNIPGGLRGYEYFASFTGEQELATVELVDYLCKEFNIPKNIINNSDRYNVFSSSTEAREFKGICSHINFRKSGKWDVGSNFPWNLLQKNKNILHPEVEFDDAVVREEPSVKVDEPVEQKSGWMNIVYTMINFILGLLKKKG